MAEHSLCLPIVSVREIYRGWNSSVSASAVERERLLLEKIAQEVRPAVNLKGSLNGPDQQIVCELFVRGGCATKDEISSGLTVRLPGRSFNPGVVASRLERIVTIGGCCKEELPNGGCVYRLTYEAKKIAEQFLPQSNGTTALQPHQKQPR